jgi:hypothetical protein
MKQLIYSALFLLSTSTLFAQPVKRYLLLEHVTNTRCSICASRNPAFFETLAEYPEDLHHIAYHPEIPYNNCFFYLHNPSQNNARKDLYNVPATPWMLLWGKRVSNGSALLPAGALNQGLGQTSSLQVLVQESLSGFGRAVQVEVEVKSVASPPDSGDIRLFVAVVEREVNYAAPNGETLHHNVFRQMLPNSEGEPFIPAAEGDSISFGFQYSFDPAWDINQISVVAFVQEMGSKTVYNSGTVFDIPVSTAREDQLLPGVQLFPNPAQDQLEIRWEATSPAAVEGRLLSIQGKVVREFATTASAYRLALDDLPNGIYALHLTQGQQQVVKKVVVRR